MGLPRSQETGKRPKEGGNFKERGWSADGKVGRRIAIQEELIRVKGGQGQPTLKKIPYGNVPG